MRYEKDLVVRLDIVVEPDEDEFHAYCPALKGLHTSGKTEEEAVNNAKDAALAYLESLIKHREPIPVGCLEDMESCVPASRAAKRGTSYHREDLAVACA